MHDQEKYILVSLEEEKAKQIANVISNATSRKILDFLSTREEASETEISKELNLPLSTIHYNLQQLKKNNLVEVKHFMYSEKGKKIGFYKVVKKFIVIAPKYAQKSLIKNILPLFLVSAIISALIQYFTNLPQKTFEASKEAMPALAQQVAIAPPTAINYYGLWFLIGAWAILIIYLLINLIKKSKKRT